MSDEEHGVFRTQAAAAKLRSGQADGLHRLRESTAAYFDDRFFFLLLALALLGLVVVWLTASSALVLYGSLGLVLLITLLWGVARIMRTLALEKRRAQHVETTRSEDSQ